MKLIPLHLEAYESLAIAYTKANQMDKAIAVLEKLISLRAGDSSVYNNLGVLYFKKACTSTPKHTLK